jgi:dihydropteroate synthase
MQFRGRPVLPGTGPFIFAVLNVTPDSFSDGGRYLDRAAAIEAGIRMATQGADVIDVGGESTRPGSGAVAPEDQIRRVEPVIRELARRFGAGGPAISIDTQSALVAEAALAAGATVVNDISALTFDPEMGKLAARRNAGVVLMHMKGTPASMQDSPQYTDLVGEIRSYLAERIATAAAAGVAPERIIIDPGIGFGKTTDHNLTILRRAGEFRELGVPVLIGPSRKRFIAQVTGATEMADRLPGTIAAVCACVLAGVECVRVHDVAACRRAVDLATAIRLAP